MYSTTHSIMYPNARHHSLYPFLNEIVADESYDIEGMAVYPDSDDYDDEDYDEDNCLCIHCKKWRKERYNPPITRLQVRSQQALLNINDKLITSYTKLSYYWFEYMEEQKYYTKDELEQKLEETDTYITEEEYRKTCDKIKERYEDCKEDTRKRYNHIDFIQFLIQDYEFDKYIGYCKEEYDNNILEMVDLKHKIFYLTLK